MPKPSKRGLVLDTAEKLFIQNGFTATGINQITRDADIASMTLYNNFKNKDDLILAVLARTHQQMREELEAALDAVGDDPNACILAIFDYMANYANRAALKHSSDGSFTGCIFNHAASEFRPLSHPIHQAVVEQKQQLLDLFEGSEQKRVTLFRSISARLGPELDGLWCQQAVILKTCHDRLTQV